jgi:GT2 family glycosyltransferase
MDYSVIICTFNRTDMCRQSILWLYEVMPPRGELLVIDQSPPPFQLDPAGLSHPVHPLRLFRMKDPSLVEARNVGLREAKGRVVIYLDDDIQPLPELIEAHLRAYEDSTVGGVAGRVLDPGVDPQAKPKWDPEPPDLRSPHAWKKANFTSLRFTDVQTGRGCNMSFLKSALESVDGFDHYYLPPLVVRDDTDACLSVRAKGWRLVYRPDATLFHLSLPSGGTRDVSAKLGLLKAEGQMYRRLFRHYRCNLYFHWKHFSGRVLWENLVESYRMYVGLSRYPWRLLAKNLLFLAALGCAISFWHFFPRRGLGYLSPTLYQEIPLPSV